MDKFLKLIKRMFNPEWKFILDDYSIQAFSEGESVNLNLEFNAEQFLKDQASFRKDLIREVKRYIFPLRSLVRPVVKLELRGELAEYKNSKIFENVFIDSWFGRKVEILN